MNKNLYRIVFNQARGILMAVAEIAQARGKGSASANSLGATLRSAIQVQFAKLKLLAVATQLACGASLLAMPLAQAQIIPNAAAPGNQRPTVLSAPNGVPLVNILTPSAAGVSRNTYSQFDVQQQGAILNNARTSVQTQLGGYVIGNPALTGGTARVILNEVNSSNPSQLRGYIEVGGDRAQVVVANPSGITCDGCGFINADRTTLTTGTPIINGGSLDGYLVQRGAIAINGLGLDSSQSSFTDIIARAVQVNAGIFAQDLKISAGANQVSADHSQITPVAGVGAAPAFAIDVAQLGGMYAHKIMLIGTETGVGVRNAGQIGASVGEFTLTLNGRLENSGSIGSASHIRIDANSGIDNSGTIYAQGDSNLATRGNIDNSGLIAAQGNTTLAATGAASQIGNSSDGVLGAGINSDGSRSSSGNLTATATQSVQLHGQLLAGADQNISAAAIDASNSQSSSRNLSLTATSGDIDASHASIDVAQTLSASTPGALISDDASLTAQQLTINAASLSNVQGEIVQTGSGDTQFAFSGKLDNRQGRIASNSQNLSLSAQTIDNQDGVIEHAGTGQLKVHADTVNSTQGRIASNGALSLSADSATLNDGSTVAQQIDIDTQTLLNQGGEIVQTGSGATTIGATTLLDNTGGVISSNSNTVLNVGDLNNENGILQASNSASLIIDASGLLNNSGNGSIIASGDARISANQVHNRSGQITAQQALQIDSASAIDNTQGTLAANGALKLNAATIDNSSGTIGSVQSHIAVTSSGQLVNQDGRIEAAQRVDIGSGGLANQRGIIHGQQLALNSNAQTLDNTAGTLSAADTLDIQSGRLDNAGGLIQASGAAHIDTHGQTLNNTNSGSSGGIVAQSTLTLATGALNNAAGVIGAKSNINANSGAIGNTLGGVISSENAVSFSATGLDNRGGQIQAQGNLTLALGTGTLDNTASLLRSGSTLDISARSVLNTDTQDTNQGLEGQTVQIAANTLDNSSGAIRADNGVALSSSGSIDNRRGLISGNDVSLNDPNAVKSLTITNTQGTLIAGHNLSIDSASLSGDGSVLSIGDLSAKLDADFSNSGTVQANGTASVETQGTLSNQGTLLAGNTLNLKAATLDNQANGKISAQTVQLTATAPNTLVNRGLIDGQETVIQTITLNNLGTGRIYGDHVAIGATTVNNEAENGASPVIAARERLDLGAQTINNREGALLFSLGDIAIGGSLDGSNHATGQADTLNNNSASIEALGNLDLNARSINNTNEHFSTQVVQVSDEAITELQLSGSPNRYLSPAPAYENNGATDGLMQAITPEGTSDNYLRYYYNRATTETQVLTSDPGQILAGNTLNINADSLLNDNSRILAGGALNAHIGTLTNNAAVGERTVSDIGSVTNFYRIQQKGRDDQGASTSAYTPPPTIQAISVGPAIYQGDTAHTGTDTQISPLTIDSVNQGVTNPNTAQTAVAKRRAIEPITQVAAIKPDTASGPDTVVRSGGVNTDLPTNSLFNTNPNPAHHFLIETDPRFTDYRQFLSSDYLLTQLSLDPSASQQRLGDGFYEQRLVREQIAQLTGRRFLDGYAADEAQYQALLNNGATVASSLNLRLGVALSAEQMAALTSDIVWLVEKPITLPNGQTTLALVPQVYVRVKDGDLNGSGSLIAGNTLNLNVTGDLINSGTLAGRTIASLTAENIKNLGGRISATDTTLTARNDLNNLGGVIDAANSLSLSAGRDINIASTTSSNQNAQGSRTNINRVAGLYITGSGGTLIASAGNDLNLNAADVVNGLLASAPTAATNTTLAAGNNVNLDIVLTTSQQAIVWDGANYRKDATRIENGTSIKTKGDIQIAAGNNVSTRAADINSSQGALTIAAGNDINITSGEANRSLIEAHQRKSKGFLSSKTTTTRDQVDETQAVASSLSAERIDLVAGNDVAVKGSNVVATHDVNLNAGNNVKLDAAITDTTESHLKVEKKSGIFSSGGVGFTIGSQQLSVDQNGTSQTATASTVGSNQGNVAIVAGKNFQQTASDVLAPAGNIDISAQKVDIKEAQNKAQSSTETKFKQSGLTIAVTSPIISAIQTAQQLSQASKDTQNSRLKLLADATTALAANNAVDAIKAGQGVTLNGKDGQIATGTDDNGKITSRDANAADQVGGINLSISIGGSQSKSKTTQSSSTAQGSTVAAGKDVNITASGAGKDSDLTIQGSNVTAGNNIKLAADNNINLLAAQSTSEQHSTNKNSSASIGISIGTDGLLLTVSASGGRGKADGNDVTQSNTHVTAGNQLSLTSGADTNLKGAVASGKQVVADVGGNLNIESLQDISKYDSKQQSIGGSVSIGYGKVGGSLNLSQSSANSDFASVTEQSGIKSGDAGFQVNVKGNTDLKGAVIASTDQAVIDGKNSLTTGTLTSSNIQNHANYKAKSTSIGGGFSSGSGSVGTDQQGLAQSGGQQVPGSTLPSLGGFSATLPVALSANGSASSTTKSGISGASINITDDPKQQALTGKDAPSAIASLNRDVSSDKNTTNALKPIFNEKEIQAGFAIASAFAREVGTLLDNQAKLAETKNLQAKSAEQQAQDPNNGLSNDQRLVLLDQAEGYKAEAKAITATWGPGGGYRQIATVLVAAASGNVTGTTGQLAKNAVVNYVQQQGAAYIGSLVDQGLLQEGSTEHAALHALVGCAGAAASNQSCGAGALGAAASSLLTNLFTDNPNDSTAQKDAKKNLVNTLVVGIAASVDGQNVVTALNASTSALDNNWLNAGEKRALNQYKLACQQQDQNACSKAAGLELLDKLRNKKLIDACVNGSSQQCKEQLALDPAAKQYGFDNIGSIIFYSIFAHAGENGAKALGSLGQALEKLEIKPLVDLKGNIQGWAVDVGSADPATLKGLFGATVYLGTEIILPVSAIELVPGLGKGLKLVDRAGERLLVKEATGEVVGKIDNTVLKNASGDVETAANSARTQPVGGGASASPSPGGEAAGSSGAKVGVEGNQVSSDASNRASHEALKDELLAVMEKPPVTDPTLSKIVDKLYRPNATVGSGSTAAAVREELSTGQPVGGVFHTQKARDSITELQKWLDRNPNASPGDRAVAENIMRDINNALRGK